MPNLNLWIKQQNNNNEDTTTTISNFENCLLSIRNQYQKIRLNSNHPISNEREYGGKVHGSQSHIFANNSMQLIVYYEVPLGMRDEVKRKFDNFVRNNMALPLQ